nr:integrase [Roseivivax halotolerans]
MVSEAMIRVGRVLAALEIAETQMTQLAEITTLTPAQANSVLMELLRSELADLLQRYDSGALFAETDACRIEEAREALKASARARDFSALTPRLKDAARIAGVDLPNDLPTGLALQGATLKRQLLDIKTASLELEDPRHLARDVVARFSDKPVDKFVAPTILLEDAIAETYRLYPSKDMKGNIDAIAKLARYHFGNCAITSITKTRQEEFFTWMTRLPKVHGKKHGRNRFEKTGKLLDKNAEIAEADADDALIIAEIRAKDLSVPEKRELLAERLTPRLARLTIRRNRDGLSRIFKAAVELGAEVPPMVGYKDIDRIVKASNVSDDALHMRVTQPKIRLPWSAERLSAFLKSPIFTDHSSPHRRWKRGQVITRDGTYWIPLFWLAVGTRDEEIVLAPRRALVLRNGVYGLLLHSKTEDGERFLPIPQVLLDLGFIDWVRALPDDHGPLLFPDAAKRSETGKASENFSRSMGRMLSRLGLKDFDEDFYALRKTFLSMLSQHGVEDGLRQAIAGHHRHAIINKHYTAHRTVEMKAAVDRADFGLTISHSPRHGFPIIRDCNLGGAIQVGVEVILGADESVECVTFRPDSQSSPILSVDLKTLPEAPKERKAIYRDLVRSARRIVEQYDIRLPKSPIKRRAFEGFLASA